MSERFKVVNGKTDKRLDMDQLSDDCKELIENGEGYVLVYKNKKDKSYYMLANSFTEEEGVYGSQMILHTILNGISISKENKLV